MNRERQTKEKQDDDNDTGTATTEPTRNEGDATSEKEEMMPEGRNSSPNQGQRDNAEADDGEETREENARREKEAR